MIVKTRCDHCNNEEYRPNEERDTAIWPIVLAPKDLNAKPHRPREVGNPSTSPMLSSMVI